MLLHSGILIPNNLLFFTILVKELILQGYNLSQGTFPALQKTCGPFYIRVGTV